MGKAKITPVQIYIIGAILWVITAVAIYFALIKPSQEALAAADADYESQKQIADKEPAAKRDRAKAEKEVATAKAKWARYDRRFMYSGNRPIIDLSNLLTAWQDVQRENITVLQPKVERFLRADRSVQVVSANIAVPAPPSDPNQVNQKVFTYDLGTVTVAGTFNDVLNHVSRWNRFDRLVIAEGLTLAGNSPRLAGTYTLRAYVFPHNADKPGANIPQAQSTQAGGFGGPPAGFGGPPAGFGGPPAGFGGPPPGVGGPPPGVGGPPDGAF